MAEANEQRSQGEIRCAVVGVLDLSAGERARLYDLMDAHFVEVDREQFFADLEEKPSLVLVREAHSERICGFSTMMLIEATVEGERIAAVFAGDTVIEPEFWGHPAWVYTWARHGFSLASRAAADKAYLLLLTSTHRSYRFMPGFFREYYPSPQAAVPAAVQRRLDALVRQKFAEEYDATCGVVRPRKPMALRAEEELPGAAPGDHPDEQFFLARNPGYQTGDYLVCLAEFTWENLTPLGRRVVSERS